MIFSKKNYIYLLKYIKITHKFIYSHDWIKYKTKKNYIILRHDVDFDTSIAAEMAQLEKKYKVKSNYFFLLRDDYYDLYSDRTIKDIRSIYNLGHNIGLHINPKSYNFFNDATERLKKDIKYFEYFYNIQISSISYHQPSVHNFKKINLKINFNSYNPIVMRYYKYLSDSSMIFDTIKLKKYLHNNNIQLLIHPVWWLSSGITRRDKLKNVLQKKINLLKSWFNYYNNLINKI
jgi:hypothetical protein